MTTQYLNGVSYSIVEITDQYGRRVENGIFILPLAGEEGLEERSVEQAIKQRYLNYRRKKKVKGWDMYFTINFSRWAAKKTALKIMQLLQWEYAISNTVEYENFRIYLTPRADAPSRRFDVIGDNGEMVMKALKGGVNSIGHSGLVLRYTSQWLSNWTTRDPDLEAVTIFDDIIVTA